MIKAMLPGGELDYIDGAEFDVPFREPMSIGGKRRADCDADGKPDDGIINGKPVFATGVDNFFRMLRAAAPDRLIMADTGRRTQRSIETLNGVETEGWPKLNDFEFNAWSTALNDHQFWGSRARQPRFSYGLLKFKGKDRERMEVPFSTVRLALAGPMLTDSGVSPGYQPPQGSNGVWDELLGGNLAKPGWLGKVRGPLRHLACEQRGRDLLANTALQNAVSVERGRLLPAEADGRIRARGAKPDTDSFTLRIGGLEMKQPGDLVVSFEISAEKIPAYPRDSFRAASVGVVPAGEKVRMAALASLPHTPCNAQPFHAVFYFRDLPKGAKDIMIVIEGAPAVTIDKVRAHASADAVVREYERGVILANPSAHEYAFDLERLFPGMKFRRLQATAAQDAAVNNGKPAENKITLGARDALFLLKQ